MKPDIASTVALVSIASLVIDRLGSGALLVFSFSKRFPDPQMADTPAARAAKERTLRMWSWAVALVLAALVVTFFESVRILGALGLDARPGVDPVLTAITLASGADFVRSVLGVKGAAESPAESPKPLEVTGKLVLEEADKKALGQAA